MRGSDGERGGAKRGEAGRGKAVLVCLLVLVGGCARGGFKDAGVAGPIVSRPLAVHTEVLGRVPVVCASSELAVRSPLKLWIPAENGACLNGVDGGAASAPDGFTREWLPRGEADTMRRFMRSLGPAGEARPATVKRIRRNLPMIREILAEHGLPLELALLPVVESGFRPWAVSPAGAAGLWQLMPGTAQRFGLRVTEIEDERFDERRSTRAAAAYLVELHRLFRDWPLALAAYNCGEGALARALARTGAGTLSELTAACREDRDYSGLLSRETLDYVPRFVGAVNALSGLAGMPGSERPPAGGTRKIGQEGGFGVTTPGWAHLHAAVAESSVEPDGQGGAAP